MKYVCDVCGWEYDEALGDPDNGIAPGTKFEDLPADFECPLCGAGKDDFSAAQYKTWHITMCLFYILIENKKTLYTKGYELMVARTGFEPVIQP